MAELKSVYGTETRVFILVNGDKGYIGTVELMNPLRRSMDEFLSDLPDECDIRHLFLDPKEEEEFGYAESHYAIGAFKHNWHSFRRAYIQTFQEQRIDIRTELRRASREPSDEEAREYLRKVNLRLRSHLENFPMHYNNPIRIHGRGGALRKPKDIHPVVIDWL
jgi:hypothetical protein